MGIFSEYLSSKGKLDKPVVKDVADKVDMPTDKAKAPPKGNGQMKPKHYADGGKKLKKAEKGFGDEGDKELVYDPEKACKNAKIPTAESIQAVKAASLAIAVNPFVVEHLIRELKKKDALGILVGELFTHNETFQQLAGIMASEAHGPFTCSKLVRAMKEEVAPPYEDLGLDDTGDDDMLDPNSPDDEELGDADLGDDDMDFLNNMQSDEDETPLEDDGMGDQMTLDGDPAAADPDAMNDDGMTQKPMPPAIENFMLAWNR